MRSFSVLFFLGYTDVVNSINFRDDLPLFLSVLNGVLNLHTDVVNNISFRDDSHLFLSVLKGVLNLLFLCSFFLDSYSGSWVASLPPEEVVPSQVFLRCFSYLKCFPAYFTGFFFSYFPAAFFDVGNVEEGGVPKSSLRLP